MTNNFKQREINPTLVIHSTDNSFGFGYRKDTNYESDELFIKKFDNDLCNNLINDLHKFVSKENLQKVCKTLCCFVGWQRAAYILFNGSLQRNLFYYFAQN